MCCPRHYLAIVCWICSYSTFELETNSPQFDKGYDSGRPETQFCEGIFCKRSQGSSNSTEIQMHLFEKIQKRIQAFYSVCDTHLFYFVVTFKICSSSVLSPKQIQPNANAILFVTLTYSSQTDFAIQTNLGACTLCKKYSHLFSTILCTIFSIFFGSIAFAII